MSDQPSADKRSSRDETARTGTGVKRPLVPVVLALMFGLVAAAWGWHLPRTWLLIILGGLLGILFILWILPSSRR
jgi:hypothetical protein